MSDPKSETAIDELRKRAEDFGKAAAEKHVMFELLGDALNKQYADLMPAGFMIWRVAEYDPDVHRAPNLWLEKRDKPDAKYVAILTSNVAILTSNDASVPALGATVNDAVAAAIAKIEQMRSTPQ